MDSLKDTLAPAAEPFLFDEEIPMEMKLEQNEVLLDDNNLLESNLLDLQEGSKTPTNNNLATSSDWMMSFESPQKLQQIPSLLDCKITDPMDVVKYTERDIQGARDELTKAHDLEIELAQAEINDLEKRLTEKDVEIKKMKDTMSEWEKAVKEMLSEREKEKIAVQTEKSKLNSSIDALKREIKELGVKEQEMSLKWKQLRLDNTDLEEANTKQKSEIVTLTQKLAKSQQQFETLKVHAQEKLEEANQEISRVHASFENENISLKSKCSRLETQNKNLAKALEGKTTENVELMKICDELEKQLSA